MIPALNIEETGRLAEWTSIFTAEAYGIHRAMEIIYNPSEDIRELIVFTDSLSVVKTLESPEPRSAGSKPCGYPRKRES